MAKNDPKHVASTDLEAKAAQAAEETYRLSFGEGLQLEVRPTGAKVWIYRYQKPSTKKYTVLTIGKYPKVSLKNAKKLLHDAKDQIGQGIDPNKQKQREKAQMTYQGETFQEVALEWYANQLGRWSEANAEQVLQCLKLDVFPHIGASVFLELEPPDLLRVIRRKESTGALSMALKVKQRIGAVYSYAVATGRAKYNPIPDIGGAMQAKSKAKHYKALTTKELPQFLQELSAYRSEVMRRAVQFALLTFARTGSIRLAEWGEIDWDKGHWNIPAEHMKMGVAHTIPLSRQALNLLEELKPFTGDSKFIFYTHRKTQPISSNALLAVLRHMGWHDRTTTHGYRALASSVLYEAGFDPHIIERQLAHAERNKIAAAYNYQAQYLAEREKIMQFWADFIDSQCEGAQVIPIRAGQTPAKL